MQEVGEALLARLEQWQPNLVVITGDLTQRARFKQFLAAKEFIKRFPNGCQALVVPGNHDIPLYRIWERLFAPYKLFAKIISSYRGDTFYSEGLMVVGINSTHPWRRIKGGVIRDKDFLRCERDFANCKPNDLRAVAFHHPLFSLRGKLIKQHPLLLRLQSMGADLVLCGHAHQSYIAVMPAATGQKPLIVLQCGTSTSARGRKQEFGLNSFNEVLISPQTITIVRNIYQVDQQDFAPVEVQKFERIS
jgi:predicted MPP superfamily phosphohydrolase